MLIHNRIQMLWARSRHRAMLDTISPAQTAAGRAAHEAVSVGEEASDEGCPYH